MAARTPAAAGPERIRFLDGLRGLSILLVILAHLKAAQGTPDVVNAPIAILAALTLDGVGAVTLFFVISGYIITRNLARPSQLGSADLATFYKKRVFRIIPAYALFLVFLFLTSLPAAWPAILTFTRNFVSGPWVDSHIWSLSIEEQFYLVWPAMMFFCRRRGPLLAAAIVMPIFWRPYMYISHGSPFHTFNYIDSIAMGCAVALYTRDAAARQFPRWAPMAILGASAGGYLVLAFLNSRSTAGVLTVPLMNSLLSAAGAMTIFLLLQGRLSGLNAVLSSPVLLFFGRRCFSLYLWQQVFVTRTFRPYPDGSVLSVLSAWPYNLLACLAAGVLSYELWEKPWVDWSLRKWRAPGSDHAVEPRAAVARRTVA